MLPSDLTAAHFAHYPPGAQRVAVAHLALFRQMPLAFLPNLLHEVMEYDFKFPAERTALDRELAYVASLDSTHLREWFSGFSQLRLSAAQQDSDWINQPLRFSEELSAHLWSTHQMDAFRSAATGYGDRLSVAVPPQAPPLRRLGIAVIGQGVATTKATLFRNLRKHGTYFTNVDPKNGLSHLLAATAKRAEAHPVPYAHWYIDGGSPAEHTMPLACISYAALAPARDALLFRIQNEIKKPGMGAEGLRNYLTSLAPGDLGLNGDALLDRFQVRLLTEGSGTQIFSTTFAQWSAREVLRRAEPLTLLVRFAPRQRQRPMNELLSTGGSKIEFDSAGSLIDADMAAYYHWINQQRLPGAERSSFVVWFEEHAQALAIGPTVPRGTTSSSSLDLDAVLSWAGA